MQYSMCRCRSLLLVLAGLLNGAGCGGVSLTETAPVSGTLKYQGQPLADAYIVFLPKEGPRATATSDASGNFQLTTHVPGDGAVPGEHLVLVEKTEPVSPMDPYAKRKSLIPKLFGNPQEATLRKQVESGSNQIVIDLK